MLSLVRDFELPCYSFMCHSREFMKRKKKRRGRATGTAELGGSFIHSGGVILIPLKEDYAVCRIP